jgi:hypothetical protein
MRPGVPERLPFRVTAPHGAHGERPPTSCVARAASGIVLGDPSRDVERNSRVERAVRALGDVHEPNVGPSDHARSLTRPLPHGTAKLRLPLLGSGSRPAERSAGEHQRAMAMRASKARSLSSVSAGRTAKSSVTRRFVSFANDVSKATRPSAYDICSGMSKRWLEPK